MEVKDPLPFTWQVRLWPSAPRKLAVILSACFLAAAIGWLCFHQIVFSLLGFIAIACATAEFWMPQRYKLDKNGASARCGLSLTAICWNDIKRIIPDSNGVKLSPLPKDGKLSPFRGVYLRFGDVQEDVMRIIQERCPPLV